MRECQKMTDRRCCAPTIWAGRHAAPEGQLPCKGFQYSHPEPVLGCRLLLLSLTAGHRGGASASHTPCCDPQVAPEDHGLVLFGLVFLLQHWMSQHGRLRAPGPSGATCQPNGSPYATGLQFPIYVLLPARSRTQTCPSCSLGRSRPCWHACGRMALIYTPRPAASPGTCEAAPSGPLFTAACPRWAASK